MYQSYLYLWIIIIAFVAVVEALLITPKPTATPAHHARGIGGIKAIVPVSSGQIGINPVISDLGDPLTYVGEIFGTDTQYITILSTTTEVSCDFQ